MGKEYDEFNGKLTFEGEFKNGKKWKGKAKEYNRDELLFEGEYINGIRRKKIF